MSCMLEAERPKDKGHHEDLFILESGMEIAVQEMVPASDPPRQQYQRDVLTTLLDCKWGC